MRIISVDERTIPLGSKTKNAAISFQAMTASAVVIEIETSRGRFKGLGFSSYGRYGHGGLLRERFIPRLTNITDKISGETSVQLMAQVWDVLMTDEKEGGHGERSGAVGVLETALWDALAKSEDLPLWALLERDAGHSDDSQLPPGKTAIYASGGHYRSSSSDATELADEAKRGLEAGYGWFKLKVGGASQFIDLSRIESAVKAAGDSSLIAVDANCAFGGENGTAQLIELDQIGLRWIEEPVNPLDYPGLADCCQSLKTPIATGENIFSQADSRNLLHYSELRPGLDNLQMDFVLAYGLTEYLRIIKDAEAFGWSRRDFLPHAGHQVALHAAAGLGLGGHETAVVPGGPFSSVSDDTTVENGIANLGDTPGTGIENKPTLFKLFANLL
jgi:L-alanine-DL-glutamate epimerase-like enolase superfamily enzyme